MNRNTRQLRMRNTELTVRAENSEEPYIEGYFAVFNSDYVIDEGMTESIAPGAFEAVLGGDIRALINHDTTLVLGRTTAGTLELKEDTHGLWGRVRINPNDHSAMDLYERVKRGDVSGCSIGFGIESERTDFFDNGDVHWTIEKVNPLLEVSCCSFPAYEQTNISARSEQKAAMLKRKHEAWKEQMKKRLEGDKKDA